MRPRGRLQGAHVARFTRQAPYAAKKLLTPRTAGGLGPLRGVCRRAAWAGDARPSSEAREARRQIMPARAAARMIPAGINFHRGVTVGGLALASRDLDPISILFARNEYGWYKRRISLADSKGGDRLGD